MSLLHGLVSAQILGLGKAPSSFGTTLALLITWVLGLVGGGAVLTWFIGAQGKREKREDAKRAADFDAKYGA